MRRPKPFAWIMRHRRQLIFSVIVLTIFLAAAEIIVRIGGWGTLPAEQVFTDVYDFNYEMLPGAINPWTNITEYLSADGFRGKKLPQEKQPGITRVVNMGDSTTFGTNVQMEEAYSYQLEQRLNARGVPTEVLNAGVPGTNLWQHLLLFQRKVLTLKPDIVIFYTNPNIRHDLYQLRRGLVDPNLMNSLKKGLGHSHLYRLLRRFLRPPSFEKLLHQYIDQRLPANEKNVPPSAFIQDAHDDLIHLQKICRENNIRLIVIPVMPREMFAEARRQQIHTDSPAWYGLRHKKSVSYVLEDQAKELGIEQINTADRFLEETYRQDLYLDEVHFNPAGHALMADILAEYLCNSGALP